MTADYKCDYPRSGILLRLEPASKIDGGELLAFFIQDNKNSGIRNVSGEFISLRLDEFGRTIGALL